MPFVCRLWGASPFPEPTLTTNWTLAAIFSEILTQIGYFVDNFTKTQCKRRGPENVRKYMMQILKSILYNYKKKAQSKCELNHWI